jgi:hypothetical protein
MEPPRMLSKLPKITDLVGAKKRQTSDEDTQKTFTIKEQELWFMSLRPVVRSHLNSPL